MGAILIDGRAVAARIQAEVGEEVAARVARGGARPGLHVVLCGDDPASHSYVSNKASTSERVGIASTVHTPAADISTAGLLCLVAELNDDEAVDAILVQLPLPEHIDQDLVLNAVAPGKDVDGFHPVNAGMVAQGRSAIAPCTPVGIMELLRTYRVPLRGARAVVAGRSVIVGRPMAQLLLNADATVTVCHSRTEDLAAVCREADVLVAAIGRPAMITAEYVKPGACVIDVGTTRVEGVLRGDVDFEAVAPLAGWITPVPGGVGPMTIATLLRNTLRLAEARRSTVAAPA
ncbi:MAG: bifunctional 5,10-methylenetetrahydrofolate dehydrogenase/5,10-methenyltetrahydrofolate cyclohydrolase [Candidatus Dormibacteria bacterium]